MKNKANGSLDRERGTYLSLAGKTNAARKVVSLWFRSAAFCNPIQDYTPKPSTLSLDSVYVEFLLPSFNSYSRLNSYYNGHFLGKIYPGLKQNSQISIPYRRLNRSKTMHILHSERYSYIAYIYMHGTCENDSRTF